MHIRSRNLWGRHPDSYPSSTFTPVTEPLRETLILIPAQHSHRELMPNLKTKIKTVCKMKWNNMITSMFSFNCFISINTCQVPHLMMSPKWFTVATTALFSASRHICDSETYNHAPVHSFTFTWSHICRVAYVFRQNDWDLLRITVVTVNTGVKWILK